MIKLWFILSLVAAVTCKNEEYMGYRVYSVKLNSQKQQDDFHLLKNDIIDYWIKPNFKYGVSGRAMVPPSQFTWFEEQLGKMNLTINIVIEDVYDFLAEKEKSLIKTSINRAFGFDGYYRYGEILEYLYTLETNYTESNEILFEVVEFGTTDQDRPLVYLKVTNATNDGNEKPVIIIEAGINPREWITIPSALNVVNKIMEDDMARFLENFEWIVIPVVNPDGYEYTHTDLRLWTKNLSTRSNLGFICPGVNINRNLDVAWSTSDSSSSPCSHLYAGTEAFSEIESRFLQNVIETYQERTNLYISLQNSGGYISYPWQYEFAASGMFRQHHLLGLDMVAAMEDEYTLDVASVALGDRASGTSSDYARINDILYTFNIDIVQRGTDGVNVPEDEIENIIEDVWRAVQVAAESLI